MIKSYKGMKAEKIISNTSIPAGGYAAKIVKAKTEDYSWGQVLVIAFDIVEGEFKDFFRKQFDANSNEDKKWKGTLRLTVPDENSQYFANNQKSFNNFIYALEESNSGYHYDCDEKKLKGKLLGVLFRNKEWEWNGNTGWTTECSGTASVEDIRQGNFKIPKDKPLNNTTSSKPTSSTDVNAYVDDEDDDLPFN